MGNDVGIIRRCDDKDFEAILETINDGARAYKGIIPMDRWSEPSLAGEKLKKEIEEGVVFWTYDEGGTLAG